MRTIVCAMLVTFFWAGLGSAQTPTTTTRKDVREATLPASVFKDVIGQTIHPHRIFTEMGGERSAAIVTINTNVINSDITNIFQPLDGAVALMVLAQNASLTNRLIVAEREARFDAGQLAVERSIPRTINVTATATAYSGGTQQCVTTPKCVTLSARCWHCGTFFTDQSGQRWRRTSGPSLKNGPPSSLTGSLSPDGTVFSTGQHTFVHAQ